jgi:glucose/arabinose dehydrogenase
MKTLLLGVIALWACGDGGTDPGPDPTPVAELRVVEVAAGLTGPVHLTAPAGDARLFVVEQPGRIRIIEGGVLRPTPFLDLTAVVGVGGERGLLSMAFDPQYATTGFFWVYYTDRDGDIRIERYRVSSNANVADLSSASLVLTVEHSQFSNHNGGQLAFGPDGMLYAGTGDGGSGGDPSNNGQNRATLLGKLLRLDVRTAPYVIPPDNPYRTSTTFRPEIWAYGLRNPWRFAFDRTTNLLYIGDVGQGQWEEIDAIAAATAPVNYGWRIMEGGQCFQASTCDRAGLTLPVHTYSHADGCSVTGGFVYRGTRLSGLQGRYFYADYCAGWLRSFFLQNGSATEHKTWAIGSVGSVLSFGEDSAKELYILSGNGKVYRLEAQP